MNIGFANYCTADTSPLFCSDLRIGPRSLNLRNVPGDLCRLKSTSRYCVALIHWGEEDYYHPRPAHLSLGRKLIDLGFDLVIGHHPHSAQGFEQYRERWIFYSLGNFFFADHSTSIDGRRYSVKWMPRRSWGLVPIFRATDDALELVEVKIVRSSRRGMPKFVTGGYLRRKLGRLSNDLAAENYWRCYRKWSAREALQIRFEEFLNNENKLRTIMRKAAERFPIGVQRT